MISAMKKKTIVGTAIPDQRGKHTPANKKSERVHELIKKHVDSIPKVSSHYTRAQSADRKYFSTELNMVMLYHLYRDWMNEHFPDDEKVKESYYRNVVNVTFNVGFAPLKTDACNSCELFKNSIRTLNDIPNSAAAISAIEREMAAHVDLAKKGQALISFGGQRSKAKVTKDYLFVIQLERLCQIYWRILY